MELLKTQIPRSAPRDADPGVRGPQEVAFLKTVASPEPHLE